MTGRSLRGTVSMALLSLLCAGSASGQSRAWEFLENNNNVIKAQRNGGSSKTAGDVTLDFFGHMAFRIVSPAGLTIVVDPWRNDPSGAWGAWFPKEFPEIAADLVLSTHAHFDHDAVHRVHAAATLERLPGTLVIGDVTVTGLADKHQCRAPGWYKWTDVSTEAGQDFCATTNAMHMDNVIQVISAGGIRIAHWGDNRPEPARHVMDALKGVDVLILPIDESHHILSEEQIRKIIDEIQPRIVIPAHYYTKGASSVLTTLSNADQWVGKQAKPVMLQSSRLVLNAEAIKAMRTQTHYFGYNFATK